MVKVWSERHNNHSQLCEILLEQAAQQRLQLEQFQQKMDAQFTSLRGFLAHPNTEVRAHINKSVDAEKSMLVSAEEISVCGDSGNILLGTSDASHSKCVTGTESSIESSTTTVRASFPSVDSSLSVGETREKMKNTVNRMYRMMNGHNERSAMPRILWSMLVKKDWSRRRLRFDSLLAWVKGSFFTSTVAVVIILNAITICANTDFELKSAFREYHQEENAGYDFAKVFWVTDLLFTCIFAAELALRLLAFELTFFTVAEGKWNVLDLVLVVISVSEIAMVSLGLDLSYIRILRLFRIFRTLRVIRTVPLFVKLRTMINAIGNSVLPLMWALVLVVFTMLMFSAVFLQGITQYISRGDDVPTSAEFHDNVEFLELFFHSLSMCVLTLFMSITSGVSWWDAERVLLDIAPQYGFLFLLYIAIMFLALLNIVTGIFVNDAVENAQMDRDVKMALEQERNKHHMEYLKVMFKDLDKDDKGFLTLEQFKSHLELAEVQALFSFLGLEVWDAVRLFEALDVDGSDELEIDEFVMGCMQLRGLAKNVDIIPPIQKIVRNNKNMTKRLMKMTDRTCERLDHLERSVMQTVKSMDTCFLEKTESVKRKKPEETPTVPLPIITLPFRSEHEIEF